MIKNIFSTIFSEHVIYSSDNQEIYEYKIIPTHTRVFYLFLRSKDSRIKCYFGVLYFWKISFSFE